MRIRVDAAIRSVSLHLAYGQVDVGVGINAPPQSRIMTEVNDQLLLEKEDALRMAAQKGLKANSFSIYRQNLD